MSDPSKDNFRPNLQRAMTLLSASSMLVPVIGVLTQPILARALGVEDRGALAAALAPSALLVAAATLGMPEAVTYMVAKSPGMTRRALGVAASISAALGAIGLAVALTLMPWLSAGDPSLGQLITIGLAISIPTLLVGVLKGAAMGHQMWGRVALERCIQSCIRLLLFLFLWLSGTLDVLLALFVSLGAPLVGALVYLPLLHRKYRDVDRARGAAMGPLVSFGSRVWLGTITEMLLSRISQVLMVPLSSLLELGLYSVAVAVSDVPIIAALAVQGVLFATNSKTRDPERLAMASRLTLLLTVIGCALLALVAPVGIPLLFGGDFAGAVAPTLLLLISAVVCVPGLMAATGVSSWGRPGVRSVGLIATLAVNLALLLVLIPVLGALGACLANIGGNVVMTIFMVRCASRICGIGAREMLIPRGEDVRRLVDEARRIIPLRR